MLSSHLRVSRPFLVVLVGALALGLAERAGADQILKNYNDSLTSYKASAKSNIQDVRPLVDQRGVLIDGIAQGPAPVPALSGMPFTLCSPHRNVRTKRT